MSIEVRKSFLNHNIIIKNNNNKEDKYKMTLEPWIITFNFGYNF